MINKYQTHLQTSKPPATKHFNQETVLALHELGDLLRQIYRRLLSEGYVFKDGKFIKPDGEPD